MWQTTKTTKYFARFYLSGGRLGEIHSAPKSCTRDKRNAHKRQRTWRIKMQMREEVNARCRRRRFVQKQPSGGGGARSRCLMFVMALTYSTRYVQHMTAAYIYVRETARRQKSRPIYPASVYVCVWSDLGTCKAALIMCLCAAQGGRVRVNWNPSAVGWNVRGAREAPA